MPKRITPKRSTAQPVPSATAFPVAPPTGSAALRVVGIGSSAGGLEACRKLVSALPGDSGMAFVLVQHLDPTHVSMMVELLADHTSMPVLQAVEGMPIEPDHLYVIPPGSYLSVGGGALRVSPPQAPHGARLPFDFLLLSLAEEYGPRAICVVLSGTGADGTVGLRAIKDAGGFVIAQDPEEAGYDGMPNSAIATGAVDVVLPAAGIPAALIDHGQTAAEEVPGGADAGAGDWLATIIKLLRARTVHDFTFYKPGTLKRRIERRMGMVGMKPGDGAKYVDQLDSDPKELALLATDLLINVTSFFRDPKVFELLGDKVVPELLKDHPPDQTVRIWIAGCSSGEETYSLAMIFREQIAAAKLNLKLQVLASDVDPDAVARAREGFYPDAIAADVSPARLARFFSKEEGGYRVLPELRATVVFTVQDVLADPPFSRLDLVSCRNLLIYLQPEAQAKVLSLFHFALRQGGVLLLGSTETTGSNDDRFEVISKAARIYRHVGRSRPGELGFLMSAGDGIRVPSRPGVAQAAAPHTGLAELCRQKVMETFAPAAVLISSKLEWLFSLGQTERYLRPAPGYPSYDLLAMAPPELRTKLRSAIQLAIDENRRVVVPGGRAAPAGSKGSFNLDVQPVLNDGERLLLVCFVDVAETRARQPGPAAAGDEPRVAELEQELDATRTELEGAIHNLEASSEEQKAINEEALSVNEEYQSANEELLTSKEELQSLNEELTALNTQLQETLERQRTTSNDLQNVLYSTNVATIFLDPKLKIRFFTPATKSLFNVIPGDIGRPLADLNSLAVDSALLADAKAVLEKFVPIEREIRAQTGTWYVRRILPYRAQDGAVEGIVVTFVDITDRKVIADALAAAEQQAQMANLAKSRFLAAASHDLRQPLQALSLMRGVLAKKIRENKNDEALVLVERFDDTAATMSGMLNTMLDINQIEAGVVKAEIVSFRINDMLERLRAEFAYHAQSRGLTLKVVKCSLTVRSDPRLLEQMIRNLLSNALKYTRRGKVLMGCRRHDGMVSIEICDTGVGIPAAELQAIFEEYRQLGNAAHERSRGLGLGLSIVKRLADLLGHKVNVRSQLGKGSVFAVDVALPPDLEAPSLDLPRRGIAARDNDDTALTGTIMVIDDDPEVLDLLALVLTEEGHRVYTAPDGLTALQLAAGDMIRPDVILTDYNLPGELNGLGLSAKVRQELGRDIPIVVLTGDISTDALREIGRADCVQLNKPVNPEELTRVIRRLLLWSRAADEGQRNTRAASQNTKPGTIFVVDDDARLLEAIRGALQEDGRAVETYASAEAFLGAYRPGNGVCLLLDAYLPEMSGLDLLRRLQGAHDPLPAIIITGHSDVPIAVEAMRAGAVDFIEKPIGRQQLLDTIDRALDNSQAGGALVEWRQTATRHLAKLTPRERQIMELVLAGQPSKNIAADLGISQRTVENHRAAIMRKTGSTSLPALARLALAAAWHGIGEPFLAASIAIE